MSPTNPTKGMAFKDRYTHSSEVLSKSMEWENENLYPINMKLKELSNEITKDYTPPLHKLKTQANSHEYGKDYVNRIDRLIVSFTSLAHAAKQVLNEDKDSKKLLGLSQVIDKWMLEAFNSMKSGKVESEILLEMSQELVQM